MDRHLRSTSPRLACCAVLTAVVILAGCGGSDSDDKAVVTSTVTTPAQPKLTRAGFITKADNACRRTQKKQNLLRKEAKGKKTAELVPTLRKQAKLANDLADEMAGFGAPAADSTRVASFVDSVRQIGVYSKALSGSLEAQHTSAAKKLARRLVRWRDVEHTLGQSYGLKVCARGNSY